jgi:hypothetical protein
VNASSQHQFVARISDIAAFSRVRWSIQTYRDERAEGESRFASLREVGVDLRSALGYRLADAGDTLHRLAHKLDRDLQPSVGAAWDDGMAWGRRHPAMPTARETFESMQRFLERQGVEVTPDVLAKVGLTPDGSWLDGRVD